MAVRASYSGDPFVGVAAAGWLESESECRCVWRAEIEEAPDDGKWGPLALLMFCPFMTELRWHWSAQAQLMRDEFLETTVSWAGVASLVGGC